VALPTSHVFPTLSLTDPEGQTVTYGVERPAYYLNTARPGLYVMEGETPDGEKWRAGFGVNAGATAESDLRLRATLDEGGGESRGPISVAGPVPLADLWPFFVLIVLAVVLAEARLAWR
jgi:hypothetical protein